MLDYKLLIVHLLKTVDEEVQNELMQKLIDVFHYDKTRKDIEIFQEDLRVELLDHEKIFNRWLMFRALHDMIRYLYNSKNYYHLYWNREAKAFTSYIEYNDEDALVVVYPDNVLRFTEEAMSISPDNYYDNLFKTSYATILTGDDLKKFEES